MELVGLRKLCSPAKFYLIISTIIILIMAIQNYNNRDIYCLGYYSCEINTSLMFIIKIVYVIFWTWILNLICNSGAVSIAWFLVLLPYIILFILLAFLMLPY